MSTENCISLLQRELVMCFNRVSSVLNRDVKQFGKKYMFDSNEETCWNSDQVTLGCLSLAVFSCNCRSSDADSGITAPSVVTGRCSVGLPGIPSKCAGDRVEVAVSGRIFRENVQITR